MLNQMINIDPEVMSGTPVFLGTHVPIKNLFDYLEAGQTIDDFLQDFPSVQKEQVLTLLENAETIITSKKILDGNLT